MMTAIDDEGDEERMGGVEHRIHLDSEVSLLFKSKRAKMGEAAIVIQKGFRRWQALTKPPGSKTGELATIAVEEQINPSSTRRSSGRKKPQIQDDRFDEFGLPTTPNLLNKLTLDNTKKNSLYTRVELVIEPVPLDQKRPDSPERKWTAKSHLSDWDDGDAEEGGRLLRWNKRLTILDEAHGGQGKAPLSPSITIPIRPILKNAPCLRDKPPITTEGRERVVVKKLLYLDDPERWAVEETVGSDAAGGGGGRQQAGRRKQKKKKANAQPVATASRKNKK